MNQNTTNGINKEKRSNRLLTILREQTSLKNSYLNLKYNDEKLENIYAKYSIISNIKLNIFIYFLMFLYWVYRFIYDSTQGNYLFVDFVLFFMWFIISVFFFLQKNYNYKKILYMITSAVFIISASYFVIFGSFNVAAIKSDFFSYFYNKNNYYNNSLILQSDINKNFSFENNLNYSTNNFNEKEKLDNHSIYNQVSLLINNKTKIANNLESKYDKLFNAASNQSREFYLFFLIISSKLIFFHEINLFVSLIVTIASLVIGLLVIIMNISENKFFILDLLICFYVIIIIIHYKQISALKSRTIFAKYYALKNRFRYSNKIIDDMNLCHITLKDKEVVNCNKIFEKSVSEFSKNLIINENEIANDDDDSNSISIEDFNVNSNKMRNKINTNNNIAIIQEKETIKEENKKEHQIHKVKTYGNAAEASNKSLFSKTESKKGLQKVENLDSNLKILIKHENKFLNENNIDNNEKANEQAINLAKLNNKENEINSNLNEINCDSKKGFLGFYTNKLNSKREEHSQIEVKKNDKENYKKEKKANKENLLNSKYLEAIIPVNLEKECVKFKGDNLLEISANIQKDMQAELNKKNKTINKDANDVDNIQFDKKGKTANNSFYGLKFLSIFNCKKKGSKQKLSEKYNKIGVSDNTSIINKFQLNNFNNEDINLVKDNNNIFGNNNNNNNNINNNFHTNNIKSSNALRIEEKKTGCFKDIIKEPDNNSKLNNKNNEDEKANMIKNDNKNENTIINNNNLDNINAINPKHKKTAASDTTITFKKNIFYRTKTIIVNRAEKQNKKNFNIKEEEKEEKKKEKEFNIFSSSSESENEEDKTIEKNQETNKFILLGEFALADNNKFFQVYFRKFTNSNLENFLDLIMVDTTRSKEAEKIEMSTKTKFFAKIAHEFKTPVNSIIGLTKQINFFLESQNNEENSDSDMNKNLNSFKNSMANSNNNLSNKNKNFEETKNILSQVENLSNYVIFLINDMIEYSNIKEKNLISNKKSNLKSIGDSSLNNANNNNNNNNVSNMNLKIEKINLREIADFCKDITQTLILSKGKERSVKILNEFDPRIDSFALLSDEFRMKQILLNFISNSVKFTKSGFIKIKSEIIEPEEELDSKANINSYQSPQVQQTDFYSNISNNNNNNVYLNNYKNPQNPNSEFKNSKIKISIIDTGMGIKPSDLQTLLKFEDNTMLKSHGNMNQGGSGLGLSITKFLAEKLNHEIEVTSEYGKGSQFSVVLKSDPKLLAKFEENTRQSRVSFGSKVKIALNQPSRKKSFQEINNLHRKQTIQDLLIKRNLDRFKKSYNNFTNNKNNKYYTNGLIKGTKTHKDYNSLTNRNNLPNKKYKGVGRNNNRNNNYNLNSKSNAYNNQLTGEYYSKMNYVKTSVTNDMYLAPGNLHDSNSNGNYTNNFTHNSYNHKLNKNFLNLNTGTKSSFNLLGNNLSSSIPNNNIGLRHNSNSNSAFNYNKNSSNYLNYQGSNSNNFDDNSSFNLSRLKQNFKIDSSRYNNQALQESFNLGKSELNPSSDKTLSINGYYSKSKDVNNNKIYYNNSNNFISGLNGTEFIGNEPAAGASLSKDNNAFISFNDYEMENRIIANNMNANNVSYFNNKIITINTNQNSNLNFIENINNSNKNINNVASRSSESIQFKNISTNNINNNTNNIFGIASSNSNITSQKNSNSDFNYNYTNSNANANANANFISYVNGNINNNNFVNSQSNPAFNYNYSSNNIINNHNNESNQAMNIYYTNTNINNNNIIIKNNNNNYNNEIPNINTEKPKVALKKSSLIAMNQRDNNNLSSGFAHKLGSRIHEEADESLEDSEINTNSINFSIKNTNNDECSMVINKNQVNSNKQKFDSVDLKNGSLGNIQIGIKMNENEEINLENENLQICDYDMKTIEWVSSNRLIDELKKTIKISNEANNKIKNKSILVSPSERAPSTPNIEFKKSNFKNPKIKNDFDRYANEYFADNTGIRRKSVNCNEMESKLNKCKIDKNEQNKKLQKEENNNFISNTQNSKKSDESPAETKYREDLNFNFCNMEIKLKMLSEIKRNNANINNSNAFFSDNISYVSNSVCNNNENNFNDNSLIIAKNSKIKNKLNENKDEIKFKSARSLSKRNKFNHKKSYSTEKLKNQKTRKLSGSINYFPVILYEATNNIFGSANIYLGNNTNIASVNPVNINNVNLNTQNKNNLNIIENSTNYKSDNYNNDNKSVENLDVKEYLSNKFTKINEDLKSDECNKTKKHKSKATINNEYANEGIIPNSNSSNLNNFSLAPTIRKNSNLNNNLIKEAGNAYLFNTARKNPSLEGSNFQNKSLVKNLLNPNNKDQGSLDVSSIDNDLNFININTDQSNNNLNIESLDRNLNLDNYNNNNFYDNFTKNRKISKSAFSQLEEKLIINLKTRKESNYSESRKENFESESDFKSQSNNNIKLIDCNNMINSYKSNSIDLNKKNNNINNNYNNNFNLNNKNLYIAGINNNESANQSFKIQSPENKQGLNKVQTFSKNFQAADQEKNTQINLQIDIKEIAEQSNLDIKDTEIQNFKITKYKILIVDDHKFLRDSLKNTITKVLQKRKILKFFEIIEGFDGVDILYQIINDQSQNNLIKCVITDENMEYLNGSDAIKIIKDLENNSKIKPIPIASISAYDDDFIKGQNALVDFFLPKPCGEKHLINFFEDFKIFYCEE